MATINDWLERVGLSTASRIQEVSTRLDETERRLDRAYEAGYDDGHFSGEDEPATAALARYGYRIGSSRIGLRDFSQISRQQQTSTVWTLYQSNGVAKRALTIKRDYILGRNTVPEADSDEALQEILDEFWEGNNLKALIKQLTLDLFLWGELCLPVAVRQTDGRVRISYIDTADIEAVITHPQNVLHPWIVICTLRQGETKKRVYKIIRKDEGYIDGGKVTLPRQPDKLVFAEPSQVDLAPWELEFLKGVGLTEYTGSCFYFATNNVSNQVRGFSDLLQAADPLDQLDETLFSLAEREGQAGYVSWDVKLVGADDSLVKSRAAEIRKNPPMRKGQANVHNDSEEWTFNAPDLKQPGTVVTADALKSHALNGMGQPPHWHGLDNTATRTTADSQNNPTNKTMETEQDKIRDLIHYMCRFVRDQAEIAGEWEAVEIKTEDGKATGVMTGRIDIVMPEISRKDMVNASQVLAQVTSALTVAMFDLQVVSRETAARAIASVMAELGVDYNADDELKAIDAQSDALLLQGAADTNGKLQGLLDGAGQPAIDTRLVLNGAQVSAALDIIAQFNAEQISRESALSALEIMFGMSNEQAVRILGPKIAVINPQSNGVLNLANG